VVLLRPDRFVAGVCAPQQVSTAIVELADKLGVTDRTHPAIPAAPAMSTTSRQLARTPVENTQVAGA
jgi:3-(3-hydroxy-phenyl)propionate hydroxylase